MTGHDNRLDGIRGLAVLLVLFHHSLQNIPIRNPADFAVYNAAGVCWIGVDLFFVLSGFLITGILLRNREKSRYFSSFYARRILRIFPLYFCLLPIILLFATRYSEGGYGWRADALYDALYLSNVQNALHGWPSRFASHLWSLSVEEQFYIVWPFLIFITPPRRTTAFLVAAIALLIALRAFTSEHLMATAVYNLFHLDGLLLGALLAAADFRRIRVPQSALYAAFAGSILLLIVPPQLALGLDWQHWHGIQTVSYTLIAVAGASLIGLTRRAPSEAMLSRLFSLPLMTAFGRFSYAVYLVHYPLDTWIRKIGLHPGVEGWGKRFSPLPSLVYATILCAISYGLSQITWHFLEKRCLELKKHFEYAA